MASAIDIKLVSPEYSFPKPNPQCDGIQRLGFGRWLSHEDGAFINGISALIKEIPENPLIASTMWGYSENLAIYE